MAQDASARLVAAESSYLPALEAAESIARECMAARREARAAIAQLMDLQQQYDLKVSIPQLPAPSPVETEIATHVAMVLQAVAAGSEPSDTVELYLRSARAKQEMVG